MNMRPNFYLAGLFSFGGRSGRRSMTEVSLSEGVVHAKGQIEGISVAGLVRSISQAGKTGVLTLRNDGIEKAIHFDSGIISFATSNHPDDRFGVRLLHNRRILLEQIEAATVHQKTDPRRIGALLVEGGALTVEERDSAIAAQLRDTVLDILSWERGDYEFVEGSLPGNEEIRLDASTDQLVLEAARRTQSVRTLRESIGGSIQEVRLTSEAEAIVADLELRDGEKLILEKLAEGPRSVDELCRRACLSHFEILQALWAFRLLGVVEPTTADDSATERRDFASFLVECCTERRTGVLLARREGVTRCFQIQEGRCTFATSDDPDDRLVHYLLRRGIITLQDAEEAARRLLTNKRIGTILLELGVIDYDDLETMVRQQLTEIVCETIRWPDAEVRFDPAEVPHSEEICLDLSVEALIMIGIRRVRSWQRLKDGLGGFDRAFALEPDYLKTLDAMGSGQEEWEVVTALKEIPSLQKLCDGSRLGAVRVCQIVWTLHLLGAVRIAVPAVDVPFEARSSADSEDGNADSAIEGSVDDAAEIGAPDAECYEDEETDLIDRAADIEVPIRSRHALDHDLDGSGLEAAFDLNSERETDGGFEENLSESDPDPSEDDELAEIEGPGATMRLDREAVSEMLRRAEEAAAMERAPLGFEASESSEEFESDDADEPQASEPQASERCDASSASDRSDATQQLDRETIDRILAQDGPEDIDSTQRIDPARIFAEDHPPSSESSRFEVSPDSTQQLRPEHLQAALDGSLSYQPVESAAAWDPPAELDDAIADFNAMQRVVFRAVKIEVGAGAVNFIRSICHGEDEQRGPVDCVELGQDGSWDSNAVRDVAVAQRIEDPRETYRQLIDRQIDALEPIVGSRRAEKLRKQIAVAVAGN